MTPQRRFEIFAKEVLNRGDIMELCEICETKASQLIKAIKSKHDRLNTNGIVHIQDYIDYFKLDIARYTMPKKVMPYEVDVDKWNLQAVGVESEAIKYE